ncbi:hypothetical protein BU17DRAFT_53375, partial [Hysterangium stoloniferum]
MSKQFAEDPSSAESQIPSVSGIKSELAPDEAFSVDNGLESENDNPYSKNLQSDSIIWSLYLEEAEKEDKELAKSLQVGVDQLLIFAGLFGAILTAFLIESRKDLQVDPLQEILQTLQQRLTATTSPPFKVSKSSLIVNYLWFSSLALTLISALCAVLAREWLTKYIPASPASHSSDACERLLRFIRAEQWRLEAIVTGIPVFIQLALFLFFPGLVLFTWHSSVGLGVVILVLTTFAVALYVLGTIFPLLSPACPIETTISR